MIPVRITVNGEPRIVTGDGATTLLHVLRDQLGLTGSKRGCDYGVCGACTVLVDGKPARACLILVPICEGWSVTTIEALSNAGSPLHPIQKAILDKGLQCGFCVPGVVLAAKALLDEMPAPGESQIRECLSGHMCRCSGFQSFVAAIQAVAEGQYD